MGVPNLGSPIAAQALLMGSDFGVFGLNPQELKKISQNMPAAYDLLPTKGYFDARGSYMTVVKPTANAAVNKVESLDFNSTINSLYNYGLNQTGDQKREQFAFFLF